MKRKVLHRHSLLVGAILIALLGIYSCGNQSVFDQNKDVPEPWNNKHKIDFDFEITDSINPHNFYINVRNTTDYEHSNFFLFVKTDFPNGQYSIDTVEIFLADLQGNWIGKGLGKNKDLQILFRKRGRFPMKGVYHMSFEQAMRDVELSGIKSLGIRIERTE